MRDKQTNMKRRSKKLIDRSLQLRLVGTFVAVGCVAVLFQVILMNQSILQLGRSLGDPGEQVLRMGPKVLLRTLLITTGVLVPVSLVIGILATHRIAGPAYRMRMYLEQVAQEGVPDYPCKVRDGDELQDLCERLNQTLAAYQQAEPLGRPAGPSPEAPGAALPQEPAETEHAPG